MRAHSAKTPSAALAATTTLLLLAALLFWPDAAHAQDGSSKDAPTSWSVRPADATGPDGRSWAELEVDPGEVVHEHLAVRNLGKVDATFLITAKDGYSTESGRFNMLESSQQNTGAGLWVDVATEVVVAAGQTAVVPYSITVPANATPGDNAAGLAASVVSTGASGSGDQLRVESRMGFKVLLRVKGTLAPSAALEDVSAKYLSNWNPFAPGAMEVRYTVHNTGNTRLALKAAVTAAGMQAPKDPAVAGLELLPGGRREVTVRVAGVWPIVLAPVAVQLSGEVPPSGGLGGTGNAALKGVENHSTVAAMPWPQLLALAGLALLGLGLVHGRRRRRAEVERLIAAARLEGRLASAAK